MFVKECLKKIVGVRVCVCVREEAKKIEEKV